VGKAVGGLAQRLVEMPWVGEHGHHQGVGQGEPTPPLRFVAVQRGRKGTVQLAQDMMVACSSTIGGWPSTLITSPLDPPLADSTSAQPGVAGGFLASQ
jgi:hypothetical protein